MTTVIVLEQGHSSTFVYSKGTHILPRSSGRVAVINTSEDRLREIQVTLVENQLPEDNAHPVQHGNHIPFDKMVKLLTPAPMTAGAEQIKRVVDLYTMEDTVNKRAKIPTIFLYEKYLEDGGLPISRIEFGKVLRNELGLNLKQTTYNGKITSCVLQRKLRNL